MRQQQEDGGRGGRRQWAGEGGGEGGEGAGQEKAVGPAFPAGGT